MYKRPKLLFNKSGEELYLSYDDDKVFAYLYRSMLKSLALHVTLVVAQLYKIATHRDEAARKCTQMFEALLVK